MNKIISNFYLIRLDGEPVYVGYTNRPIKTRFKEHLRDKDFGEAESTVEKLGELSYDFTWDISLINRYAKEVSDRETELIEEYSTQDSVWQKGINGSIGGQTWANVKSFVRTNRDNPTFREMDESDIMELLDLQRRSYVKLQTIINGTNISGFKKLQNMITNTRIKAHSEMQDMVNDTRIKGHQRVRDVISHMSIKGSQRLRHVIIHTDLKNAQRLTHIVTNTNTDGSQRLRSLVGDTTVQGSRELKNVVGWTTLKGSRRLRNVIGNTKAKY